MGALARALAARPTVLVIDTYEVLGLLDAWLRTQFLPALPATTLTVLAGRDRPATAWHTTAGWQGLVAEFPLAALSADEADQLLRRRGLDERQARWAGEFAHGHPLALELAAAAVRADPRCTEGRAVAPDGLLEAFLGQLPPATVTLVEAASTVRRITEPVLAAMLETPSARAAFDVLRALPFTEPTDDGLLLHDVVRDTVGNDLSMRDPDRRRAYRRRAVAHLTEHRPGTTADPWLRTADLMFLIENPVLRDACFPSVRPAYWVEPATPRDRAAVFDIVARHESPPPLLARRWWERHAETFSVARGRRRRGGGVRPDRRARPARERCPPTIRWPMPGAPTCATTRPPPTTAYWSCGAGWAASRGSCARPPCRRAGWTSSASTCSCVHGCAASTRWSATCPGSRRSSARSASRPRANRCWSTARRSNPSGSTSVRGAWTAGWPGSSAPRRRDAGPAPPSGSVIGLSSRELEVLRLVADGRSNREIGELLFISEKTAGRHLSNIFTKLDVHSRAEAARIAAEQGLTQL